jgi:hypothetical protein
VSKADVPLIFLNFSRHRRRVPNKLQGGHLNNPLKAPLAKASGAAGSSDSTTVNFQTQNQRRRVSTRKRFPSISTFKTNKGYFDFTIIRHRGLFHGIVCPKGTSTELLVPREQQRRISIIPPPPKASVCPKRTSFIQSFSNLRGTKGEFQTGFSKGISIIPSKLLCQSALAAGLSDSGRTTVNFQTLQYGVSKGDVLLIFLKRRVPNRLQGHLNNPLKDPLSKHSSVKALLCQSAAGSSAGPQLTSKLFKGQRMRVSGGFPSFI